VFQPVTVLPTKQRQPDQVSSMLQSTLLSLFKARTVINITLVILTELFDNKCEVRLPQNVSDITKIYQSSDCFVCCVGREYI